ncbi:hypothetical protein AAES_05718 [Amazona aestiva]|uniref:Uncharacterized protein n=1 Tax=Amazona aestiva TaxID=12930 RepID=A0A0Q3XA13_AMAAE|nr:hypothetical protein AAES_05718 [Amazona aestiva]
MYQLHPSSVSVEEEKKVSGGKTATLPLFNRAERTKHLLTTFLGPPSSPTHKASMFLMQEPASPLRDPAPHPSMLMLCDWRVPSNEALTCTAHASPELTRERTQTPKMIMFF